MIRCPVHNIPDCSPLLNGCSLPNKLNQLEIFREALIRIMDAPISNNIVVVRQIAREALHGN